jgi:phage terminase large subunit-like protein
MVPTPGPGNVEGERRARRAGAFLLTQGEHAGKRLKDVWLPWQVAWLEALYGMGIRRSLVKCGKGSGKTTLAAALALEHAVSAAERNETRGSAVIIASTVSQAHLIWDHALEAVLHDPMLAGRFTSHARDRALVHGETGYRIKVIPPTLEAAAGLRPCLILGDEMAIASESSEYAKALDALRRGARNWGAQAREVYITTASPGQPVGAYAEELNYARRVRDGEVVDPVYLPLLYEWPVQQREDLDLLTDELEWWRGMPSLSTPKHYGTMPIHELREEFRDSAARGESSFALLLSQRFGVEADARAMSGSGATQLHELYAQTERSPHTDIPRTGELSLCVVAHDPGGVNDPHAVATSWTDEAGIIHVVVRQYLSTKGFASAGPNLVRIYEAARKAGELLVFDTFEALDAHLVAQHEKLAERAFSIPVLGGDVYGRVSFASHMARRLATEYVTVKQGWQILAAVAELEGMMADGKLKIAGGPLIDYNFANVRQVEGPRGRVLQKAGAGLSGMGDAKIDGVMAVLSAVVLRVVAEQSSADVGAWIA